MRYEIQRATQDWSLLEVCQGDRFYCSDPYWGANITEKATIFSELRLLRAAGCPPDKLLGNPEIERVGKHKPAGSKTRVAVYVLKAKPTGWRLYFYVKSRELRQIEFLFSVHKKKDSRDPEDFEKCKNILDAVFAGEREHAELYLPPR